MTVAHKTRAGLSERAHQRASEITVEAIAQAQRQIEFERDHVAYIKRTALEALKNSEQRMAALQRHIAHLRELSDQHEKLAAA